MGSYCWPTIWDTRAAIGTAETPAEPIKGLMVLPQALFMILAVNSPPMVEMMKAAKPQKMIRMVSSRRKLAAEAVAPTEIPRKMVTMFMSSFWAVLERRSVTPQTLSRLPNMRQPTSPRASGTIRPTTKVTTMGKSTFSSWETGRRAVILMVRSFLVVSIFMKGGWIIGMSAI